jgi:hypothetical protein
MIWYLGETRYAYAQVSSSTVTPISIDTATYCIYDTKDDSVVASGIANIDSDIVYAMWTPNDIGTYVFDIVYNIDSESFMSRQVIDVRETM